MKNLNFPPPLTRFFTFSLRRAVKCSKISRTVDYFWQTIEAEAHISHIFSLIASDRFCRSVQFSATLRSLNIKSQRLEICSAPLACSFQNQKPCKEAAKIFYSRKIFIKFVKKRKIRKEDLLTAIFLVAKNRSLLIFFCKSLSN